MASVATHETRQKPFVFFVGREFPGSFAGFAHLPTLSQASTVGNIYNHMYWVFHLRGCLSLLAIIRHIFSFSCKQPCDSVGLRLMYRVHQSITKHNIDSYHALTPMSCDIPVHKCNAIRHCMSIPCHVYIECYMDNLIYAYTVHLGQL